MGKDGVGDMREGRCLASMEDRGGWGVTDPSLAAAGVR